MYYRCRLLFFVGKSGGKRTSLQLRAETITAVVVLHTTISPSHHRLSVIIIKSLLKHVSVLPPYNETRLVVFVVTWHNYCQTVVVSLSLSLTFFCILYFCFITTRRRIWFNTLDVSSSQRSTIFHFNCKPLASDRTSPYCTPNVIEKKKEWNKKQNWRPLGDDVIHRNKLNIFYDDN